MPQPENQRVAAGIDQLVNPTRLEAAWNVDVRIRRNDRMLGALVVEADPAFDARESPALGRYWDPRVSGIAAPRQARFARVQRQRRMAARRGMATQRKRRDAAAIGDVLDPDGSLDRRDRQVEHHPPVPGEQIALPGEPYDRIAAAHQKAVSGVRQAPRIVRGRRVIEELQHPLVAAVAVIEKDPPVAAAGIGRLQDREIPDEPDEPFGIDRCLVDVGDACCGGACGSTAKRAFPTTRSYAPTAPNSYPSANGNCSVITNSTRLVIPKTPLVSLSWPGFVPAIHEITRCDRRDQPSPDWQPRSAEPSTSLGNASCFSLAVLQPGCRHSARHRRGA